MRVGPGGVVVVIGTSCQTEFQFCEVPRIGGVKSQLLFGVRIELAVGSLPMPHLFRGGQKGVNNASPWAKG